MRSLGWRNSDSANVSYDDDDSYDSDEILVLKYVCLFVSIFYMCIYVRFFYYFPILFLVSVGNFWGSACLKFPQEGWLD